MRVSAAHDPYADLNVMRLAFAHVRSVVAVERFGTGETATVEYAKPNRFHITMRRSQIVLAGNVEYDKKIGGVWKRSPNGAEHQAMLSAAWNLAGPTDIDIHKLFTITSLGTRKMERATVRGYLLHDTAGAYDEIVWVGPNYLPVMASIQMPDQTLWLHFIAYNTSVIIATPNNPNAFGADVSVKR